MTRPFNIVAYDMKTELFECVCVTPDCSQKYWISMAMLPHDTLGMCNQCERGVHALEDLLRKSSASTAN